MTLHSLGGGAVELPAAARGKILVVDFFATWCRPCRVGLPALERLRAEFADRNVMFVSVSIDAADVQPTVADFARALKVSPPILLDPEHVAFERLGVRKLPTTYVVDARGVVQKINHGCGPGFEARLRRWLLRLLATH
jgi:thiol-disulfide isomerase/thioredoxin